MLIIGAAISMFHHRAKWRWLCLAQMFINPVTETDKMVKVSARPSARLPSGVNEHLKA